VPFAWARTAVGSIGVDARMPYGEARSRARRIANDVLAVSFQRFSEIAHRRGSTPVVLALNVVLDRAPDGIPLRSAIDAAGLPVFDLFDVYPADDRAALRVAPWDDHPNAEGHQIIAERLYRELTRFLSSGTFGPVGSPRVAN
jgi:hypothetical protein